MERIKKYLEEASQTDPALKAAYDEGKLKSCWDYIKNQARKTAVNGCAMIEDAVVYKWARDFMFGDIAEEDKKKADEIQEKTDKNEEIIPDMEDVQEDLVGQSEKLVIEKVEQVEKPAKKKKEKKEEVYDGPGLFDDLF